MCPNSDPLAERTPHAEVPFHTQPSLAQYDLMALSESHRQRRAEIRATLPQNVDHLALER
jgi:hypothetical protein